MSHRARLTDLLAATSQPAGREYAVHDAVLRGFMLRVRASGVKSWVLRIRQDGRPQRILLGDATCLTVEAARQRAHALLSGAASAAEFLRSTAITLKKFAGLYIERKGKDWRPLTLRTHQCYLNARILPALGKLPLDRIGALQVADWFHAYSRTRPGGANRAMAVLSDLMTRAIEWGVLPSNYANPCHSVPRNRTRARGQMLNAESIARLGAALEKYALIRPDAVDAIQLLLLTGARPGEICGLQWKEVEAGRITLAQSKRGPRTILLGKSAVQILNARRKRQAVSRFVFPHRTLPDHPMPLPTQTTWVLIKREAQLPTNLRLHDLRHNFASHALLAGESLLVAGALLGHSRPTITARYAHLADDALLQAAQRIGTAIAEMASPQDGDREISTSSCLSEVLRM